LLQVAGIYDIFLKMSRGTAMADWQNGRI